MEHIKKATQTKRIKKDCFQIIAKNTAGVNCGTNKTQATPV